MRKLQLIFLWLLVIALCGCGKKDAPVQQPNEIPAQGEAMEITAFSFTHTGMSTEQCFLYSAEQTKEGIRLYTEELFAGGLIVDTIVEEPVLEQLGEIAGKYRLDKWDGFDKSNKQVMDGNQFSLSVTLADGKTILAHGNNRFPDGYEEAKQEICLLFAELIETYADRESETTESPVEVAENAEPETAESSIGTEPENAESEITESSIEAENNQATYEQWYKAILDANYELIMGGAEAYDYMEGTSGIGEIIMNSAGTEADAIGYGFIDVNQDGVAELIIGSVDEEKEGKYYSENIYSAYTYHDIPYLLTEGWSRNRCFLLEDGTFYTEGSAGAMYTIFENSVLEENATQLSYKDMYFTMEKDEFFEEIGFYHNTTGEWDASVSEELEENAFWSEFDAYGSRTIRFEVVPFSKYQYVGEQKNIEITEDEVVSVEWISGEQLTDSQMWNFVADSSQPQVIAAFYANEKVRNLKVLALTYEDVDEMGNVMFSTEELCHYGDFGPGNPFAITLTMYGTIPCYGISYETADGRMHYYAISESGRDGSAELVKFEPKGD